MNFNFDFKTSDLQHTEFNDEQQPSDFKLMSITFKQRSDNDKADIIIYNEDETLGAIIHELLLQDKRLSFVGYRKDHKLDTHIRLTLKLDKNTPTDGNPSKILIQCLQTATQTAIQLCIQLRNTLPGTESQQRIPPNFNNNSPATTIHPDTIIDFNTSDLML